MRKTQVHLSDQVTQHRPAVRPLSGSWAGEACRSHRHIEGITSDHPQLISPGITFGGDCRSSSASSWTSVVVACSRITPNQVTGNELIPSLSLFRCHMARPNGQRLPPLLQQSPSRNGKVQTIIMREGNPNDIVSPKIILQGNQRSQTNTGFTAR